MQNISQQDLVTLLSSLLVTITENSDGTITVSLNGTELTFQPPPTNSGAVSQGNRYIQLL